MIMYLGVFEKVIWELVGKVLRVEFKGGNAQFKVGIEVHVT